MFVSIWYGIYVWYRVYLLTMYSCYCILTNLVESILCATRAQVRHQPPFPGTLVDLYSNFGNNTIF